MTRFRRALPAVAIAVAVALSGCDAAQPWAAIVGEHRISRADLDRELEAILGNERYVSSLQSSGIQVQGAADGTFDSAFVARILTRQIFFQIVRDEVERRDLDISRSQLDEARLELAQQFEDEQVFRAFPDSYQTELVERNAEVTALSAALSETDISDDAIAAYYDENKDQLFTEACYRHILVSSGDDTGAQPTPEQLAAAQGEAGAALARLAAGEDFAAVAAEVSDDPGSAQQGGELPCSAPGSFVPEFEAAGAALQPGQRSGLVQTSFGFHIIELVDRRARPLDEVEGEIRQRLLSQGQAELTEFLSEALETASIEVNPQYGSFNRAPENPGELPSVVPPVRPDITPSTEPALSPLPGQ